MDTLVNNFIDDLIRYVDIMLIKLNKRKKLIVQCFNKLSGSKKYKNKSMRLKGLNKT